MSDTRNTSTVLAAPGDAWSRAGTAAESMPYLPASGSPFAPDDVDPADLTWAETLAPGGYASRVLARGTRLRLTDVTGDACANVLLLSALGPWERLNVADTQKVPWQAYLGEGHPLLSGDGRVLATVVADSSGHHGSFCGTTSDAWNVRKYGDAAPQGPSPSGRGLFTLAASKQGLGPRDLAPSVSFFQGVRVEADGSFRWLGSAGPGTSVDLLAEVPLIVLLANTAHPLDPRDGFVCTPLEVLAWRGSPTGPADPLRTASPDGERDFLNSDAYLTARGIS